MAANYLLSTTTKNQQLNQPFTTFLIFFVLIKYILLYLHHDNTVKHFGRW